MRPTTSTLDTEKRSMWRVGLNAGTIILAMSIGLIVLSGFVGNRFAVGKCPHCRIATYARDAGHHECFGCGRVYTAGEAGCPLDWSN